MHGRNLIHCFEQICLIVFKQRQSRIDLFWCCFLHFKSFVVSECVLNGLRPMLTELPIPILEHKEECEAKVGNTDSHKIDAHR